ncbi:MAG: hypothetical protein ACRDDA_13620, partial [Aeromonas sp.]
MIKHKQHELWGKECRNIDIRINADKAETPMVYEVDYTLEFECFNNTPITNGTDVGTFPGNCITIWHLDKRMY